MLQNIRNRIGPNLKSANLRIEINTPNIPTKKGKSKKSKSKYKVVKDGDPFESFIKEHATSILEKKHLNHIIAKFGQYINNSEYDMVLYSKNASKRKLFIDSIFELKDQDFGGVFNIFHKYKKFVLSNKGHYYLNNREQEILFQENTPFIGLIKFKKKAVKSDLIIKTYFDHVINSLYAKKGYNYSKLLYDTTADEILEVEQDIKNILFNKIIYVFVGIKNKLQISEMNNSLYTITKSRINNSNVTNEPIKSNLSDAAWKIILDELSNYKNIEIHDGNSILFELLENISLVNGTNIDYSKICSFIIDSVCSNKRIDEYLNKDLRIDLGTISYNNKIEKKVIGVIRSLVKQKGIAININELLEQFKELYIKNKRSLQKNEEEYANQNSKRPKERLLQQINIERMNNNLYVNEMREIRPILLQYCINSIEQKGVLIDELKIGLPNNQINSELFEEQIAKLVEQQQNLQEIIEIQVLESNESYFYDSFHLIEIQNQNNNEKLSLIRFCINTSENLIILINEKFNILFEDVLRCYNDNIYSQFDSIENNNVERRYNNEDEYKEDGYNENGIKMVFNSTEFDTGKKISYELKNIAKGGKPKKSPTKKKTWIKKVVTKKVVTKKVVTKKVAKKSSTKKKPVVKKTATKKTTSAKKSSTKKKPVVKKASTKKKIYI